MPAVVLLVDLQLGIECYQIGGYDTPENQLRPHWKTSPHSALAAPVTLASLPSSFTESCISPIHQRTVARAIRRRSRPTANRASTSSETKKLTSRSADKRRRSLSVLKCL